METIQFDRRTRMLLMIPLLIIPMLALVAYSLGLGQGRAKAQTVNLVGLNKQLPEAHLPKTRPLDKLAIYDRAEMDSMRLQDRLKMQRLTSGGFSFHPNTSAVATDTNLERVNRQMAALKRTLSFHNTPSAQIAAYSPASHFSSSMPASANIDRLEAVLRRMSNRNSEPDPDLADLKQTLDKLAGLQNPSRQRDSSQDRHNIPSLSVTSASVSTKQSKVWLDDPSLSSLWHDLDEPRLLDSSPTQSMIEALIPQTQSLTSGSVVRLELVTDLIVGTHRIPAGNNLYGICQLGRGRLQIIINSIKYRDRADPVVLQVYDQDGLPGISVPESASHDALREMGAQGAANISGSLYGNSLVEGSDLSSVLAGQATTTGIQLARNLASRKIREFRVSIPEGYSVFLKDMSQKK